MGIGVCTNMLIIYVTNYSRNYQHHQYQVIHNHDHITSSISSDDSFRSFPGDFDDLNLDIDPSEIFGHDVHAEDETNIIQQFANTYCSVVKKEIESSPSPPPPPSSQQLPPTLGVYPGLTKDPSPAQNKAALELIHSIEQFIKWSTKQKKGEEFLTKCKTYLYQFLMSTNMGKLAPQNKTAFIQIWRRNSTAPNGFAWIKDFESNSKLGGRRRSKITRKSKSSRIKTTKGKRRTNRKMRRKRTTLRKNK